MAKTLIKSTAVVGIAACVLSTQVWAKPDKDKGGPNIDCPAGTSLVAKFEWGSRYVFEKPAGSEKVVAIADGATASGGTWTATTPISHLILKGGTGTFTYDFGVGNQGQKNFDKNQLPPNSSGSSPDISNIQFCALLSVPPSCQVYGVHDEGLNDSHFFTIDPENNFQVAAFGEVCDNCDIEGLDTNQNGDLYGSSGDDPRGGHFPGCLYKINNGQAVEVCQIANDEASAIAFRPTDDSLWAWLESRQELVKIDNLNPVHQGCDQLCDTTLMFSPAKPIDVRIEAMSWNLDGTVLYAADTKNPTKTVIWAVTIPTMVAVSVCDHLLNGIQIEALETIPDGRLMSGVDGGNDFWLFALDVGTCEAEAVPVQSSFYSDVEGIAYCLP
ncbi:MAG: hypothetical protein DRR19_14575 [Candidatus Parabeggiatoa sp. nov. 1]|nr:MAG: hypothetical protein DRR19_14575 [Gammaproteobacteria bacterium]